MRTSLAVNGKAALVLPFSESFPLKVHARDIYEIVHDGIDGEASRRMDLEFAGNVATVGDDGVGGNAQVVGNLLVGHSLHEADDDVLLAVAEHLAIIGVLVNHVRDFHRHVVLLGALLQPANDGDEYLVLHLGMQGEPLLVVIDVV